MQIVLVYLQLFWRNSILKCVLQCKIVKKKFTKTCYFRGLRSFKVIDVEISKKVVGSACCDKKHIYAILKPFLRVITCFTYGQNLGVLTFIILLSYTGNWGESLNSRVGYRIKRFADVEIDQVRHFIYCHVHVCMYTSASVMPVNTTEWKNMPARTSPGQTRSAIPAEQSGLGR